ncbi:MAG: hypothetical protein JKY01_13815 [Pseudomonadales bacterium]|nr:hypothetical protein [Pseudomonadales bacterium]
MTDQSQKQLLLQYRVEAGCLGPTGQDFVEDFCFFAYSALASFEDDVARWEIIPRYDKGLAEFEYRLHGTKSLSRAQAVRYLQACNKNLDEMECAFGDKLSELIDEFGRQFSRVFVELRYILFE